MRGAREVVVEAVESLLEWSATDIEDYFMYGGCAEFALALNDIFGYSIVILQDTNSIWFGELDVSELSPKALEVYRSSDAIESLECLEEQYGEDVVEELLYTSGVYWSSPHVFCKPREMDDIAIDVQGVSDSASMADHFEVYYPEYTYVSPTELVENYMGDGKPFYDVDWGQREGAKEYILLNREKYEVEL